MAWACECGCSVPEEDSVCGDCGRRRVSDPEALATYEGILVELAAGGNLSDEALAELAALRADLRVALQDHERLMVKHALQRSSLPLSLAVDEATLSGFLAGRTGFVRVAVHNGGARMLKNVRVRYAVSGEDAMREHAAKTLSGGHREIFGATIELPRGGHYMLELVLHGEDMLGKVRQAYRADPVGFAVAEVGGGGGPSTLVVNTTVEASAMRVAGDPLASVSLGGAGAGPSTRAGALSEEAWRKLALRPITPSEWEAWALQRDARARAEAARAAEAAREAAEAAARAKAEAAARAAAGPKWRQSWMSACGEDTHGSWAEAEVAGVTFRFRYCPAGTFQMGSPASEEGRDDDERQHEVQLTRGFWLGATPVTQRQWEAVTGKNPSKFKGPDRPVEQVSWEDCVAFLGKVNARCPGLDLRLPTEAEWEYACREGTTGPTYLGVNDAATLDRLGWYEVNSGGTWDPEALFGGSYEGGHTHPVGQKAPNAWGLYDTLGNVWEWCADWTADYPSGRQVDPMGPSTGEDRVNRGGSWYNAARFLRAANRCRGAPRYRFDYLGFRAARSSP
jgi:sulfatase modifying factor 1